MIEALGLQDREETSKDTVAGDDFAVMAIDSHDRAIALSIEGTGRPVEGDPARRIQWNGLLRGADRGLKSRDLFLHCVLSGRHLVGSSVTRIDLEVELFRVRLPACFETSDGRGERRHEDSLRGRN